MKTTQNYLRPLCIRYITGLCMLFFAISSEAIIAQTSSLVIDSNLVIDKIAKEGSKNSQLENRRMNYLTRSDPV